MLFLNLVSIPSQASLDFLMLYQTQFRANWISWANKHVTLALKQTCWWTLWLLTATGSNNSLHFKVVSIYKQLTRHLQLDLCCTKKTMDNQLFKYSRHLWKETRWLYVKYFYFILFCANFIEKNNTRMIHLPNISILMQRAMLFYGGNLLFFWLWASKCRFLESIGLGTCGL